tara:strand:+ start:30 stop:368 length:339 start_codon:yes stop_codon:yes gene_type:complete
MATYTSDQLNGTGSLTEELAGTKTFTFTNPSGSSYFVLQTIPNSSGVFDSTSPKNAVGTYVGADVYGLVTSSYVFGTVVHDGVTSFTYTPTTTVAASSAYLKGTGEFSLTIS